MQNIYNISCFGNVMTHICNIVKNESMGRKGLAIEDLSRRNLSLCGFDFVCICTYACNRHRTEEE